MLMGNHFPLSIFLNPDLYFFVTIGMMSRILENFLYRILNQNVFLSPGKRTVWNNFLYDKKNMKKSEAFRDFFPKQFRVKTGLF